MRERNGRTLPRVFKNEDASVDSIKARVGAGSTVYADQAACWDELHAVFAAKRVNHSVAFMDKGVCTNQAESFFSRLRRAEIGTHHCISRRHLQAYANEMAWREDTRRLPNGTLYSLAIEAVMAHPVSENWKGYWQKGKANGQHVQGSDD
jgi:transposase-like protein